MALRVSWIILMIVTIASVLGLAIWSSQSTHEASGTPPAEPAGMRGEPLRIGLVPEHNIFAMRDRYRAWAACLSGKLGRPVEIVMLSSYEAVLDDFKDRSLDAAFLGSLVALIAIDCLDARPLARPEFPGAVSTYRGVIFVRDESPIHSVDDLRGKSIAMLKSTTAGSLFPLAEFNRRHWMDSGPNQPQIVWLGTHDQVVSAVVQGQVDAGAAKDLRLDAYLQSHPGNRVRCLATGPAVPNLALVARADVAEKTGPALTKILLEMHEDPAAQPALKELGTVRFIRCAASEFDPIYDLIRTADWTWNLVGVTGAAPQRR